MQIQLYFKFKIPIHHKLFGMFKKLAVLNLLLDLKMLIFFLDLKLKMVTIFKYALIVLSRTSLAQKTITQFLRKIKFLLIKLYGLLSKCKMVNGLLEAIMINTFTDVPNVLELIKTLCMLKLTIHTQLKQASGQLTGFDGLCS